MAADDKAAAQKRQTAAKSGARGMAAKAATATRSAKSSGRGKAADETKASNGSATPAGNGPAPMTTGRKPDQPSGARATK